MQWTRPCAYDHAQKRSFHATARRRLAKLAKELELAPGSYEIRSNQGGIAVSGEITLHSDSLYVQVAQSCMGASYGILIRTCKGRKDYTGGPNNWAAITMLNDIPMLAARCRRVLKSFDHQFLLYS